MQLAASDQISDTAVINMGCGRYASGSYFELLGNNETIGALSTSLGGGLSSAGANVQNGSNSSTSTLTLTASSGVYQFANLGVQTPYGSMSYLTNGGTQPLNLVINGTFTQQLYCNCNYTGTTTITSGTLELQNVIAGNTSSQYVMGNNANAILTIDANVGIGALSGGGSTGGNVNLGSNTLSVGYLNANTSYGGNISGTGNLSVVGTGTLTLGGTNTYTGETIVGGGIILDFSNTYAPSSNIISASSMLSMNGATILLNGKSSVSNSQTFNSTSLVAATSSTIAINDNSSITPTFILGTLTQNSGATVNFITAGNGTSDQIIVSGYSANQLIGGWALVNNSNFAGMDSTNTYITSYNNYTQVSVFADGTGGGVVPNNSSDIIQIIQSGTTGNMTLAGGVSASVSNIVMSATSNGTISLSGQTLTLGTGNASTGAILSGAGAGGVTIGSSSNDGILTVGTSGSSSLIFYNFSSNSQIINSSITNGTSSIISINTPGPGTVIFTGNNGYTGSTSIP